MGRMIPVILDSICENVVVWRTDNMTDHERSELHVRQGELSFCRVSAKSGSGREDDNLASNDDSEDDV